MFPSGQYREKANDDCSFFVIYAYDNPIMVIMSIVINKDEVHKTRYKTKKFKKKCFTQFLIVVDESGVFAA